jgi:type II secretory pathway component PulF
MNWKDLLNADLGALMRRLVPFLGPTGPSKWLGPKFMYRRRRKLIAVTNQLCAIVRCNAPLVGGLESAAIDAPDAKVEAILLALRDDLAAGFSLSEAMRARTRFFPRDYVDMVAAGERTGTLYEALSGLSDTQMSVFMFHDMLKLYLMYFTWLLCAQLGITAFIMSFIVPEMVGLVGEFGGTPPPFARGFFRLCELGFLNWWRILFTVSWAIVLIHLTLGRHLRQGGRIGAIYAWICMCVPFVSDIVVKTNLGHAANLMENLLRGGIPMDEALEQTASGHLNPLYARRLAQAKERVSSGLTLSESLAKGGRCFPSSFVGMVAMGESSGLLPDAFGRIGALYHREAQKAKKILTDLGGSAGILVCASLTFTVVYSVFSTLVEVYDAFLYSM